MISANLEAATKSLLVAAARARSISDSVGNSNCRSVEKNETGVRSAEVGQNRVAVLRSDPVLESLAQFDLLISRVEIATYRIGMKTAHR